MDKEALLNIILSDLGEVETMIKSFQGQEDIPSAFIELTEKKLTHLVDEFSLLKNLNSRTPQKEHTPEKPVTIKKTELEEPVIVKKEVIIESAPETPIVEDAPITIKKEPIPEPIKEEEIAAPIIPAPSPEVVKPKEPLTEIKNEDAAKTLGESFVGEKKSVNDLIANTQDSNIKKTLKGKPVSNLTKGLGINDRFMFQRELFSGKAELMNQTLQQLNEMPDFTSAQAFIQANFNWDNEIEVTQAFLSYVERKF